jgi:hypothetical protein
LCFTIALASQSCGPSREGGSVAVASDKASGGGTFGETSAGTFMNSCSGDAKRASLFSLGDAGASITKLTAYVDGGGASSGSQPIQGVIYNDDGPGGAPGTLACHTGALTISASQPAAWQDLAIAGTCALGAGSYYLGLLSGQAAGVARYGASNTSGVELHVSYTNAYASGPSNPWGTDQTANIRISIYATYTPSTFGRTSVGTFMNGCSGDAKRASRFDLAATSANITKLTVYADGGGATSGSQPILGVVYDADGPGGGPGTLACQTSGLTIAAGQPALWLDLPLSGSCALSAGSYYLGILSGQAQGVARYGASSVAGALHVSYSNLFANGPSNPWGADNSADVEISIYATYVASSCPPSGCGGQPAVSLAPAVLSFPNEMVAQSSPAELVTLTNSGNAVLSIASLSASGDFAIDSSGTCSSSLSPGTSCTLSVRFSPTAVGTRTGALSITDNAPGSPHTVPLTGAGVSSGFTCSGTCYWVSTSGNDSSSGTQSAPFRHLSRAAAAAHAGDTVVVMDGTYDNEGVVSNSGNNDSVVLLSNSGASSAPITFTAEHRGQAILDASSTTLSSTEPGCYGAWAYFDVEFVNFIVIEGFVIQNACEVAVRANGNATHDITLRWNEIRNIGNSPLVDVAIYRPQGIYMNSGGFNFTIDGNVFHDIGGGPNVNQQHGVYTGASNVQVINNIFYNQVHGWDVQTAGGTNVLIANNTFAFPNPDRDGHVVIWDDGIAGSHSNVRVVNNVFFQPRNVAVTTWLAGPVQGCALDHNLTDAGGMLSDGLSASNCTVDSSNRTSTDPMLAQTSSPPYDFRPAMGSPVIDTGASLSSVQSDIAGTSRPQGNGWDLGAYEHVP